MGRFMVSSSWLACRDLNVEGIDVIDLYVAKPVVGTEAEGGISFGRAPASPARCHVR
jgi:hypothetical protein